MSGSLVSLDHVMVAVDDLEGAARDHARLLGRAPSWRGEHPAAGSANALFRLENTYLELLAPEGAGPVGDWLRARIAREGEGVAGIAFGTEDAEACRERFVEAGLDPAPLQKGVGRDVDSGAFREWSTVMLPPGSTRGLLLFAIEHRTPPEVLPQVDPFDDPSRAVQALDHVVVQSGDGDASRALYEDALGLRLALDRSFERFGFRGLFFRVGGATVEVTARLGGAPDEVDRLFGLAWQVGDVTGAQRRLADADFDVSEVRTGRKAGTSVFTVRDAPAGVPTLVIGPEASSGT